LVSQEWKVAVASGGKPWQAVDLKYQLDTEGCGNGVADFKMAELLSHGESGGLCLLQKKELSPFRSVSLIAKNRTLPDWHSGGLSLRFGNRFILNILDGVRGWNCGLMSHGAANRTMVVGMTARQVVSMPF